MRNVILNPSFISYDICLDKPAIVLKGESTFTEWIKFDLGQIHVVNRFYKTAKRAPNMDVWGTSFVIKMENMQMLKITENEESPEGMPTVKELSKPYTFDVEFAHMMFIYEYEQLYPKIDFCKDKWVDGKMTPFKMIFEKCDYLALLRMTFFNLTRYDGLS